jgi:hypothetical protein
MRQTPTLMLVLFFLIQQEKVLERLHTDRIQASLFFLQQGMVKSTSCKSIIRYQYLSLTFLTCSYICLEFFFVYIPAWKDDTQHTSLQKMKNEAISSLQRLSGIKSLISR